MFPVGQTTLRLGQEIEDLVKSRRRGRRGGGVSGIRRSRDKRYRVPGG